MGEHPAGKLVKQAGRLLPLFTSFGRVCNDYCAAWQRIGRNCLLFAGVPFSGCTYHSAASLAPPPPVTPPPKVSPSGWAK